ASPAAGPDSPVDAVTWVPLSARRLAERGFDQARALAEVVGSRLHLPVARLLVRTTDTGSQARRSGPMRRAAMAGAFESAGQPPPLVLLVDDVLTTGATAAACARTLLDAGASRVRLLTAARALAPAERAQLRDRADILAWGSRLGLWLPGGTSPGSRCQPRAKRPT